jgi:2-polyprenyl-6-hydroxyphenyl methylase / 3-demethylubiquinone-9 3-methyltransferase
MNGNINRDEVGRFTPRVDAWWDPNGSFRALHRINPVRLDFIRSRLLAHFARDPAILRPFAGLSLVDIGCGGGLVAEAMSRLGFAVTAVDADAETVAVARMHAEAAGLRIDYRRSTAETLAAQGENYDVVLALELIEHLLDRDAFYEALGKLVGPGGAFIAATLNRTTKSFVLAIVGGEYILNWLPPGSHRWSRFVHPCELALNLRLNSLQLVSLAGMSFTLPTGEWSLSTDLTVNYLAMAVHR